MTQASDEFKEHVCELLDPLGRVSAGRFFGGVGLFYGNTIFAMLMGQVLYLRVDDSNRGRFEDAGAEPFSYNKKDKRVFVRTYFEVPEEVLDDQEQLVEWARLSVDVALKADRKKAQKKKAAKGKMTKGKATKKISPAE